MTAEQDSAPLTLEDRLAIQELFSLYGYCVDDGRKEEWLELFTEDGVFDIPGFKTFTGRAQVREVIDMVVQNSDGFWRHQLTNVLPLPGPSIDTATVRINGLVSDWRTQPPTFSFMDYSGLLCKQEGRWRIVAITAKASAITI
jgi:hypothetical protein